MPYAREKLPRNSKDLAGGEADGWAAGARCCKSIIAAHAECYLLCGDGGLHGVAPCGDPEAIGSARNFAHGGTGCRRCAGGRKGRIKSTAQTRGVNRLSEREPREPVRPRTAP